MPRMLAVVMIAVLAFTASAHADRGQIAGTVADARSGIAVSVHPVMLVQGRDTLARTLTDRLGKFTLEFTYTPDAPLILRTGSTTGYLQAEGEVEAGTEVAVAVMPRWATIIGIVTDHRTGRGLADIPVQAARGERSIPETWAGTKTDAAGVFMLKVPASEGDDLARPVEDLWLQVNEGREADVNLAVVRTDLLPLWAWPDATQPTQVEVSLPAADATGLTIADVVSIKAPPVLRDEPVEVPATHLPPAPAADPTAPPVVAPAPDADHPVLQVRPGEAIVVCPHCGKRFKIVLIPLD